MKTYKILAVELTDFETFSPYPGANEFSKQFAAYESGYSYYKFYNEKDRGAAEKKLKAYRLKYKVYGEIELEGDEEISNYPAIAANPLVEYDLTDTENGKTILNFKKIGAKNYLRDFHTEKFIFSEKAKKIFDLYCPHLKYESCLNEKNKKKYYIPNNISHLADPMIIVQAKRIEGRTGDQHKETFYPIDSDGRITVTEKSMKQIRKENFCICSSFRFAGKTYKQAASNIFASGKLALALAKQFPKETGENFISPYTLNNI